MTLLYKEAFNNKKASFLLSSISELINNLKKIKGGIMKLFLRALFTVLLTTCSIILILTIIGLFNMDIKANAISVLILTIITGLSSTLEFKLDPYWKSSHNPAEIGINKGVKGGSHEI